MEHPWIPLCTQKIDVMEIQEEYDYLPFIQECVREQENQQENLIEQEQQAPDEEWEEEEDEWEEER